MTPQLISIYALVAMFVVATLWPINMGVLAFVGAFLVGTLLAGQKTAEIIDGFPGGLFLTLVGITWLFALAQNNGTIDWLVRLAVRAVKGRLAAIPWIMFLISALLTSVGAVSPGAVAIIAPIALGFAFRYQNLAAADGPDGRPRRPGRRLLPDLDLRRHHQRRRRQGRPAALADDDLRVELLRQRRRRAAALHGPRRPQAPAGEVPACSQPVNVPHIEIAKPATGPQIFGDSEAEALSPADRPRGRRRAEPPDRGRAGAGGRRRRQPLPDRHPRRAGAARRPRPRLQARHRLRLAVDRPRAGALGAEHAEAGDEPGRLAGDHAHHRRQHLCRGARAHGHDHLRRRQRRGPRPRRCSPRCCSASSARSSRPSPPRPRSSAR